MIAALVVLWPIVQVAREHLMTGSFAVSVLSRKQIIGHVP